MKRIAFICALVVALPVSSTFSANAATKSKTKKPAPAAGKACTAKEVGTPIAGAGGVLLDCVKNGTGYKWTVSKAAVTTIAAPTTIVGASVPASTVAAKNDKWPDKLVFAVVPAENATATLAAWAPFKKALEKELGIPVEQVTPSDYAGVIEAQLSGKVDLAMYGPFSYYLAKKAGAKIEPIAVQVRDIGLPPSYRSYLVAKADSPINSINDVKGKKLCFVDTASTSGYLYPQLGLKEANIASTDYTQVLSGGHDKSVVAVKAGTCDAGFAFDDMVDKTAVDRGLIKQGEVKVIWRSKPIPNSPIAVRTELPDALVAKLKKVVPNIDSLYLEANKFCSGASCSLAGLNAWVPVNDSFFDPIAEVCAATNAAACNPPKK